MPKKRSSLLASRVPTWRSPRIPGQNAEPRQEPIGNVDVNCLVRSGSIGEDAAVTQRPKGAQAFLWRHVVGRKPEGLRLTEYNYRA